MGILPPMRRLVSPLAVAAVGLTACGKNTIKPDGAAKSVREVVIRETGFRPTDVKCPSGVEAKVGGTFDCHFTGPEGPYTAHVRITKVDGKRVRFFIRTVQS